MSQYTTTTFTINWQVGNTTSNVNYKVFYRLTGTTQWTSFVTSGSVYSATIHGLTPNSLYDIQIQNNNGFDNPISSIYQGIGFTDPTPVLSPTNSAIGYGFNNLSSYITSYVVTIATAANPGNILQTQTFNPVSYNTGIFSGLAASTAYLMNIQVVVNEFTHTFSYAIDTTLTAACPAPTAVSAYLTTSGTTINVQWTSPVPYPACNYEVYYRPKSFPNYSLITTSGTTSGTTAISLSAPACYEGYMQSNCCSNNLSINVPFGVNSYQQLFLVSIYAYGNPSYYYVQLYTKYPSPYTTNVGVTFNDSNHGGSLSGSVVLPAGVTSGNFNTSIASYGGTISNQVIQSILPIFDNGGSIQQTDTVLTPNYFGFISTSGNTWSGSPIDLPSFGIDGFEVTELSTGGLVNAGQILVSWIYDTVYDGGISPYDTVTFTVLDGSSNVMGTLITHTGTLGLQNATINIADKSGSGISSTTPYRMKCTWTSTSVISTKTFYLPVFVL